MRFVAVEVPSVEVAMTAQTWRASELVWCHLVASSTVPGWVVVPPVGSSSEPQLLVVVVASSAGNVPGVVTSLRSAASVYNTTHVQLKI